MARLRSLGEEDNAPAFGGGLDNENAMNGHGLGAMDAGPAAFMGGEHFDAGQTGPGGMAIPAGYAMNIDAQRSGETPREREMLASVPQLRSPVDNGEHANDAQAQGGGGGGNAAPPAMSAPPRPRTPTPMAGSVSPVESGGASSPGGVVPFTPMDSPDAGSLTSTDTMGPFGSPDVGSFATPTSNGMFGSMGGLKGGGLGLPMDPMSNQMSDPISILLRRLSGGQY